MSKEKIYNHNVKTATNSELEPVELFFVKKFNESRESGIDFLSNGNNTVSVLYFNDANSCVSYDCFCTQEEKTADGKTNFLFRFTVNKYKEYNIDEAVEGMELSDKCVFLLPPSRVVMAEPIKKYIDNAAPEDKESLKNELEKLVGAEECTPIDKVCAKLVLENKAVKFVHSTLPKNNQEWLKTNQAYYFLEGVLLNAAINIKNIGGENDANESENSESQNNTIHQLRKKWNLTIEKGKQIEPQSQIIEKKYCTGTTWEKLLAVAGIDDDTFKLRLFPDAFARVYILLGKNGENNPLKPVAYIHTSWQEIKGTRIKVVRINLINTGSDKAVSSGVTPAQGPVDNTNNEKPAGAGTKKGENTKSTNDNTQTKEPNVDLTTAFRREKCDTVNILCAMVRLYSACAWFMIVVREFIECLYNKDYDVMKLDYKNLIGFKEFKTLKGKGNRSDDEETRLKNMENGIYGEQLHNLYKWPEQSNVYDYGNCHVLLTALSNKLKENQDAKSDYDAVKKLIDKLKDNIDDTRKIRNAISHYDFEKFNKLEINVDEKIKTIISFIEEIKKYERFEHLSKYLSPVQKLLVQPVSIMYCPKCGEELPGGEYTFRPEHED